MQGTKKEPTDERRQEQRCFFEEHGRLSCLMFWHEHYLTGEREAGVKVEEGTRKGGVQSTPIYSNLLSVSIFPSWLRGNAPPLADVLLRLVWPRLSRSSAVDGVARNSAA